MLYHGDPVVSEKERTETCNQGRRHSRNPSAVCGAKTRLLLGRDQQEKLNCTVQTGPELENFKFTCKHVSCDFTEEAGKRLSVFLNI